MKINLGCGTDIREGWTNVDAYYKAPGVVNFDMMQTPWPLESNSVDYLLTSHVLEHIPPLYVNGRDILFLIIEEAHRVLKKGSEWEIRVPIARTLPAEIHIQHYRQFHPETFDYFAGTAYESWLFNASFRMKSRVIRRSPDRKWANPAVMSRWRYGGTSVFDHIRVRFPFLEKLASRPGEIQVILQKE